MSRKTSIARILSYKIENNERLYYCELPKGGHRFLPASKIFHFEQQFRDFNGENKISDEHKAETKAKNELKSLMKLRNWEEQKFHGFTNYREKDFYFCGNEVLTYDEVRTSQWAGELLEKWEGILSDQLPKVEENENQ